VAENGRGANPSGGGGAGRRHSPYPGVRWQASAGGASDVGQGGASDVGQQVEIFVVFVLAAFPFTEELFGFDKVYALDPFDHFVAELIFHAKAERSAVNERKRLAIHARSQKALRLEEIFDALCVVVLAAVKAFSKGVKGSDLGLRLGLDEINERLHGDATPLCDAAPALNAMMHGDVLGVGKTFEVGERKLDGVFNEAADFQAEILEIGFSHTLPILANGHFAIGPEVGGDVLLGIFLAGLETIESEELHGIGDGLEGMLERSRMMPGDVMGDEPGGDNDGDTDEAENHADGPLVVGTHDDMVHVASEPGQDDESDMDDEEGKKTEHGEEMDGACGLAAPEKAGIPGEAVDDGWRHGDAGEDCERAKDENNSEVGDLLESVVAIETIWLGRKAEGRVVDKNVPSLEKNEARSRDDASPLLGGEQHDDEKDASDDEAMDINEVPNASDANGVAIAGSADHGSDIAGVILGGPKAIARDLQRREANPFAAGRAMVVEIEPGMIHQDGDAAANQEHEEKEIEEMSVAHPNGEAVGASEIIRVDLGDGRNVRLAVESDLDPGRGDCRKDEDGEADENRGANPDAKATIGGIVNGLVRWIKCDHAELRRKLSYRTRIDFHSQTEAPKRLTARETGALALVPGLLFPGFPERAGLKRQHAPATTCERAAA